MAVARTERGRSIEQRFCFNFSSVPEQVEALCKVGLSKARIELQRKIEGRERFVIPMRQAKSPSKYALAEAIKVIECNRDAGLTPGGFQSSRPILRVIDKGTL